MLLIYCKACSTAFTPNNLEDKTCDCGNTIGRKITGSIVDGSGKDTVQFSGHNAVVLEIPESLLNSNTYLYPTVIINTQVKQSDKEFCIEVLTYLNEKAGTDYRLKYPSSHTDKILARRKDGATMDEIKKVIDCKVDQWKGTESAIYLRPETLFNRTKFSNYLGQINVKRSNVQSTSKSQFNTFANAVYGAGKLLSKDSNAGGSSQ